MLDNRTVLSVLFMLPAASILLLFLTYPLGLGIWMGFTDVRIGRPGVFIGLDNYISLFDDERVLAVGVQHARLHHRRDGR